MSALSDATLRGKRDAWAWACQRSFGRAERIGAVGSRGRRSGIESVGGGQFDGASRCLVGVADGLGDRFYASDTNRFTLQAPALRLVVRILEAFDGGPGNGPDCGEPRDAVVLINGQAETVCSDASTFVE
jgi:hypothetical protein